MCSDVFVSMVSMSESSVISPLWLLKRTESDKDEDVEMVSDEEVLVEVTISASTSLESIFGIEVLISGRERVVQAFKHFRVVRYQTHIYKYMMARRREVKIWQNQACSSLLYVVVDSSPHD